MKSIKVLFLIDNLACGGKERRMLSLLKGMNKFQNIQCEIALIDEEIFYDKISEIKIHVLGRSIKKDPFVFIKLYNLCKKIRPDIIHSWGSMPSVYGFPIAKLLCIKFVNAEIVSTPSRLSFETKLRTKLTFAFSDVIVSNSVRGLKCYDVPSNKGHCIHNGFDFNRIQNLENSEKVKLKLGITTSQVVGMVAAIYPKKDFITFILAAIELLKRKDNVSFLIVGDGEKLSEFKELTRKWNRIIYTGAQHNVESIINILDIGVMITNSDYAEEGISNSILEYMALEKPAIATKAGATSELVEDGSSGFLIESRDSEALTERIEYLLDNPAERIKMGQVGKKIVMQNFSFDSMINDTISIYSKVINDDQVPESINSPKIIAQ